jgi:hypothetical protein
LPRISLLSAVDPHSHTASIRLPTFRLPPRPTSALNLRHHLVFLPVSTPQLPTHSPRPRTTTVSSSTVAVPPVPIHRPLIAPPSITTYHTSLLPTFRQVILHLTPARTSCSSRHHVYLCHRIPPTLCHHLFFPSISLASAVASQIRPPVVVTSQYTQFTPNIPINSIRPTVALAPHHDLSSTSTPNIPTSHSSFGSRPFLLLFLSSYASSRHHTSSMNVLAPRSPLPDQLLSFTCAALFCCQRCCTSQFWSA